MWRALVIIHRYLGVAAGALMVMRFLSGIVMMYVGFPRVTETERIQTLEPIVWSMCCRSDVGSIADDDQILAASLENLSGSPALTLRRPGRPDTTLDLALQTVVRVDAAQALSIARDAAPRLTGQPATPQFTGQVQTDQWMVGRLVRDRPLFRFELDDPAPRARSSMSPEEPDGWCTGPRRLSVSGTGSAPFRTGSTSPICAAMSRCGARSSSGPRCSAHS
jgi:hypothetical protein